MDNTQKKTKILNYINVFRGLAILLIIAGHTMQFGSPESLAHIINCEIVCGGTALFIFISGFLFQHLSYKFEYKNYLSKKYTNVICPYLITSIAGLFFCFYYPIQYKNSFFGLPFYLQIPIHLSIGRVHNVPSWFILMITIFFLFSYLLLKLEKQNILYKLLPVLFLITVLVPRGTAEYENTIGLDYLAKYWIYVKYILLNFVHFTGMYVFGMYCSKHKEVIDKFYSSRGVLWALMLLTSATDVFLQYKYQYSNYTVSKIFLTMLLVGYLKHYDEFLISHSKINKIPDILAKYSFGLFFIHWYWFFIYRLIFNTPNVTPIIKNSYILTYCYVSFRFLFVTLLSFLTLFIIKQILLKINKNTNTRMFIGV